jgi:hypothetical protein
MLCTQSHGPGSDIKLLITFFLFDENINALSIFTHSYKQAIIETI